MSPLASLQDEVRFCFSVDDFDGNGEIDRRELTSILIFNLSENGGAKLFDEQPIRIIDRTDDKNGDGGISLKALRTKARKNSVILSCVNINCENLRQS
jgi:Ca2+-binding EF-hand superfamily protein